MGIIWPKAGSFEWNSDGTPADGALAYFYAAGTSTPLVVYEDGGETTPISNPVVADGYGRWPTVFVPYGSYKVRITSAASSTLWTADDIPNPAPTEDTFTLDATTVLNTGDIFLSLDNGTRSGCVRLNARSIGSASSSATERANDDTADLFTYLWNKLGNAQAPVSGGRGASGPADFAANKRLTLPDWRGTSTVGFDDMGSTGAGILGLAPLVTGDATTAGSILGQNTHTLVTAEIAAHTHSGTTASNGAHTHTGTVDSDGAHSHTVSITDPGHTHTSQGASVTNKSYSTPGNLGTTLDTATTQTSGSSTTGITASTNSTGAHTHTFTTASGGAHTHTFTTDNGTGSATAFNILQRSGLVTYYIKL